MALDIFPHFDRPLISANSAPQLKCITTSGPECCGCVSEFSARRCLGGVDRCGRGPFAVNFLCAVFMVGGVGGGDRLGLIVLGLAPLWVRTERAGSNLARVGLAPPATRPAPSSHPGRPGPSGDASRCHRVFAADGNVWTIHHRRLTELSDIRMMRNARPRARG